MTIDFMVLSANTKAILLLTAPLILGKGAGGGVAALLTSREYAELAKALQTLKKEPADLLRPDCESWMPSLTGAGLELERIRSLLGRGFQLAQAVETWSARSIWVVSRADPDYPQLLKKRLREQSPPLIYGCGNRGLLRVGGLAVVGSRKVDDGLLEYTRSVGALAAEAGLPIVSGGAKGVDQAAMGGALQAGGAVLGVLVESLARQAIDASLRDALRDGRLLLLSMWDPALGFDVGRAMARNKLIYALADAALVVASDLRKGGTWAGADEQLRRHRFLPVYVREDGGQSKGLKGLQELGAGVWPDPACPDALKALIANAEAGAGVETPRKQFQTPLELPLAVQEERVECGLHQDVSAEAVNSREVIEAPMHESPANLDASQLLWERVSSILLEGLKSPMSVEELCERFELEPRQVKVWLKRLESEGRVEIVSKQPVRYQQRAADLFG